MQQRFSCLCVGAACLTSAASAGVFSFASFPNADGLSLNGDALVTDSVIRLTNDDDQAGSAWFLEPVSVSQGFETTFTYNIHAGDGADGLAFVVQSAGLNALGGGGGDLGLVGIGPGAYVAFQSFLYDTLSIGASDVEMDVFSSGLNSVSFAPRGQHHVRIVYTPGTLEVFVDGARGAPTLAVALDLTNFSGVDLTLGDGTAYVGFTGATGLLWDHHDIENWAFVPSPGGAIAIALASGLAGGRRRR